MLEQGFGILESQHLLGALRADSRMMVAAWTATGPLPDTNNVSVRRIVSAEVRGPSRQARHAGVPACSSSAPRKGWEARSSLRNDAINSTRGGSGGRSTS